MRNVATRYRSALGAALSFIAGILIVLGAQQAQVKGAAIDPPEQQIVTLLNAYRVEQGLPALVVDNRLQAAAEWKANDMAQKGYFAHFEPVTNRSPWDMMCQEANYCFNAWKGENLAAQHVDAPEVFAAWKSSPGHNANMLGPNYRGMGIALVQCESTCPYNTYWVQEFGSVLSAPSATPTPVATTTPTLPPPATIPPTAGPSATPKPCLWDSDGDRLVGPIDLLPFLVLLTSHDVRADLGPLGAPDGKWNTVDLVVFFSLYYLKPCKTA